MFRLLFLLQVFPTRAVYVVRLLLAVVCLSPLRYSSVFFVMLLDIHSLGRLFFVCCVLSHVSPARPAVSRYRLRLLAVCSNSKASRKKTTAPAGEICGVDMDWLELQMKHLDMCTIVDIFFFFRCRDNLLRGTTFLAPEIRPVDN